MFLFFDTETTGFPNSRLSSSHPEQARLVQLAALLVDQQGRERASVNLIIRPGVPIPRGASDIHGITDEVAELYGIPESTAVNIWHRLTEQAPTVVAHNLCFDWEIMTLAYGRIATQPERSLNALRGHLAKECTMLLADDIIRLPPTVKMLRAGFNKTKAPNLAECVQHLFGETLDGAHDALVDVRACARVFFELRARRAKAKEAI